MATARVATTISRLLPVFVYGSGDREGRHACLNRKGRSIEALLQRRLEMLIERGRQGGDAAVTDVLLEQVQEVTLVVRLEQVQVEEGFGLVGTGDGEYIVVDTQGGERSQIVGVRGTQ